MTETQRLERWARNADWNAGPETQRLERWARNAETGTLGRRARNAKYENMNRTLRPLCVNEHDDSPPPMC